MPIGGISLPDPRLRRGSGAKKYVDLFLVSGYIMVFHGHSKPLGVSLSCLGL
jgi:hypothetical protein